jgi:hypothetical protein
MGRYQSQLLNFLNRQSQRLRDRGGIFLRQIKLAALWGGQLALYPIYALFQASRMATRQLRSKFQQALHALRPAQAVPADLSIQRLLDALTPAAGEWVPLPKRLVIGAQPPQLTPLTTDHRIQAIASSRETRQLLLVTDTQATLDILTDAQQQQIQARIVWELATYWKLWRQWQEYRAARQLVSDPTGGPQLAMPLARQVLTAQAGLAIHDRPQLAAPVRLFYQLMAWVQQSALANRINLFHEIELIPHPQTDWFQPHFGQLPTDALIVSYGVAPFDWQAGAQTLPQTNPIGRLIQAAIHYFFGRTPPTLRATDPRPAIADPWESPLDVVAVNCAATTLIAVNPATSLATTAVWQIEPCVESHILPHSQPPQALLPVQQGRALKRQLGSLVQQTIGKLTDQETTPATTATQPTSLTGQNVTGGADLTWNSVFTNDLTTSLIDTVATPIGYVKHPLEQLLGWLDQGILWLERHIAQLWQRSKHYCQKVIQRVQSDWSNSRK